MLYFIDTIICDCDPINDDLQRPEHNHQYNAKNSEGWWCKTDNAYDFDCQVVMRVSEAMIINELYDTINCKTIDAKNGINQIENKIILSQKNTQHALFGKLNEIHNNQCIIK